LAPPVEGPRVKASPLARLTAQRLGVDLAEVTPTGPGGLITEADVEAHGKRVPEPEDRATAMRRAIARSMAHSKREIPHYYLATRIDMNAALDWLEAQNEERPITDRLLPAVLLLKATALAAGRFPNVNGHWTEEGFRPSEAVHLGVAVSIREGGLVAPAIHNAHQLSLDELMSSLRDLVARARSWRLRSSEMSDPTITVTNLGDRGVEVAFPVIVPPQVAMVAFGKVVESVVAKEGEVVIHPVVTTSLAGDHRVTDGHTGGLLLAEIDRLLQEPELL
jgi:pyruvate dehydrogenase E2 component (dihydrolipoamide acetyltransferase)